MSLINKYLEVTPLTSTENTYVKDICFEKVKPDFGSLGAASLKRRSSDLGTKFSFETFLTSTRNRFLPPSEVLIKRKHLNKNHKYAKRKRIADHADAELCDYDMEEDESDSYNEELSIFSEQFDGIHATMNDSSVSMCPPSPELDRSPNFEYPNTGFCFGAAAVPAELFELAVHPNISFEAAPAPAGLFGSAAKKGVRFMARDVRGALQGQCQSMSFARGGFQEIPLNIPETTILKMPSYELEDFQIQEELAVDIFTLFPRELHGKSINYIRGRKLQFLNVVSMALMYSSNFKDSNDEYRITLIKLAEEVKIFDPEFILKVALYARQELHIRAATNFLLSYAAVNPSTRLYLEKYFGACIVLPSDWMQVAEYFEVLKVSNQSFPAALRRVMKKTFAKFDEYQLAKYNRDKTKKKGDVKVMSTDSSNEVEKEVIPSFKSITLKHLIRTLHINSPVDHVMCLLGKKYPENYAAFQSSGLPGKWDPTKAGKRMKLTTPETWETQISSYGNKPNIWESLLDKNKLPYMAMLRNLKNLVLSGISPMHHKKIVKYIENKKSVIHSRQLPMQFFEAYKALSDIQNTLESSKGENPVDDSNKKSVPVWKRNQNKKILERIKNASPAVIDQYKNAISNALEISSLNNLHPIPGKTLVICEIPPKQQGIKIKTKILETCIMMGIMCMKACEDCKMSVLYGSTSSHTVKLHNFESFLYNMMVECNHFKQIHLSAAHDAHDYDQLLQANISSLKEELDSYLKPQIMLSTKLDHIVFLHISSDDAMKSIVSSFLLKYRQIVNSDLLYTDVNFSLSSNRFLETCSSEKDAYLCGSSSSLIKYIAERSSGGQLAQVENVDLKYKLPEVSEIKKVGHEVNCNLSTEEIMPMNYRVPKWHTVRIFISSTFKDMVSERDLLIRYVFPELRKRAASVFVRIAEIDLRWGITEADSANKRAAELCLLEAQKSDLFVGFLGDRYGTIYSYDPPDDPDLQWVEDYSPDLSITELEMHAAALRYPTASSKKAFFYFRNNNFLKHVPQKWRIHFSSEDVQSEAKVTELKCKIKSSGLRVFDGYPCHWAGIFENRPVLAGLDILGGRVLEDLWIAIQDIHRADPFSDEISEEEMYHQNLINSVNFFVGKKAYPMDTIVNKIKSEHGIFVVSGSLGSGKTAFSINLLKNIGSHAVVKYFVGVSPRSQDISHMIRFICLSICRQLSISISLPDLPHDIVNQFPDFLVEAANNTGGRDVILLIDGLDHLEPNDQRLDWLPLYLPNRIKLICTTSESSSAFKFLCERQARGSNIFIEGISPLQQSDREEFVRNYLSYYAKILDEDAFNNHMLKLVTKKDSSNPLYLRIVCDFLRIYASFENLITLLQKLPSTLMLLFQEIILQMENEFGINLVQTALSLLCISKLGLEDNDLHYILSFIISVNDEKGILSFDELKRKIALVEPENLLSQVKYCSLMHVITIFTYGQFSQTSFTVVGTEFEFAVKKFYLNKNYATSCKYLHSVLAAYYHRMCDSNDRGKYSGQSAFAIRALLYHLFQGCLYKELSGLLCNHQFIEAVFRTKADEQLLEYYSSLLFDILETNQKISREIDYDHLFSFYDFVSRNFHIFHRYPQLVMQQALNESSDFVYLKSRDLPYHTIENLSKSQVLDCRLATLCGFVKNITASAGGKEKPYVYLGSEDGYIKVLDVSMRKVLYSIKSHFSAITCICYAGKNRICASSADGTLSLWDSQNFSRVAVLEGHRHNVTCCCADPSGCILFSSGWDNSIRLWSLKDGRSISVIDDFRCPVNCIDSHPVKQQIACGLWNGNIEIWDTVSMKQIHVFGNVKGAVKSITYSPDGVNIISSFMQSEILILSSEEGLKLGDAMRKFYRNYFFCEVTSLKGHILPVKSFTYSYDDSLFISGSDDCTLKVWSSTSESISSIEDCKFYPISVMAFISERLLAIAFQNSEIWVIDINSGKPTAKFQLAPDAVSSFSKFSPTSFDSQSPADVIEKELVFGAQCGKLMIGDLLSSSITVRAEMKSRITAILHNCHIIICGSADGDIGLFSYSGELISHIVSGAHNGFVTNFCLNVSDEGLYVISTSSDQVIKLWNIEKISLDITCIQKHPNKHRDTITCSIFQSPECCSWEASNVMRTLLTGSHDNNIILWDDYSEMIFKGLRSSVLNIAYSDDCVLGCGNDGSVVVWSSSGKILTSIPGIELSSATLTFYVPEDISSGFNIFLAFVDKDGSVKITKPLDRTFSCSLEGHSKPITSCCTSINGEIISCSLDGSVNLWKMPVDIPENHAFHTSTITGIILSSLCEFALSSDAHGTLIMWKVDLKSSKSPLVYAAKKTYKEGFIRRLSWLKNDKFVCAVVQHVDCEEKFFLNTCTVKHCSLSENETYYIQVDDTYHFESEILCLDSCNVTDTIIVGLKSGDIMVITPKKQKLLKMSDDWLLGVCLFTREKTSDLFCASFVDGRIKLFAVTEFLECEISTVAPFGEYEPRENYDCTKFTTALCCGVDRLISCGDLKGVLRIYAKHSLKFSEKVHTDSITGICILDPYIFTSSLDRTVKGWDLSSFKQICQYHSHVPISCLAAAKIYSGATNSTDQVLIIGTTSGEVQLLKFFAK